MARESRVPHSGNQVNKVYQERGGWSALANVR